VKVVFTAEARADLDQISDYIAEQNLAAALAFVAKLRVACRALAHAPLGYPVVPRYRASGIRRRAFGNYLIFYRVRADAIEVIHILHGARDYARILFPDK
jgi:toxin ParE1/3/4